MGSLGLMFEFVGAPGRHHLAGIHRYQPVEPLRLVHVGGRDQHAHCGATDPDAVDQLPELSARQRVNSGGWLIEDQQIRVVNQRTAQPELLLHPAGQLSRRAIAKRRQVGAGEQLAYPPLALLARLPEQPAEEVGVLKDRQRRIKVLAQPLRHICDAREHRVAKSRVGYIAAEHCNFARLYSPDAGDDAKQRRFSNPVGPYQANHLAGGNVQVHAIEGYHSPVTLRDFSQARYRSMLRQAGVQSGVHAMRRLHNLHRVGHFVTSEPVVTSALPSGLQSCSGVTDFHWSIGGHGALGSKRT